MQQQGILIPHPPVISTHPTTRATINDNEFASFLEGILRAGQLESTCDDCADVTDGSPVVNLGRGATKLAVDDPASESGGYGLQPIWSPSRHAQINNGIQRALTVRMYWPYSGSARKKFSSTMLLTGTNQNTPRANNNRFSGL
jgi:hypothetical protein